MGQRLPEPGTWYDDPEAFAALTPGAKPRRPLDPELVVDGDRALAARQRVRARPSAEALAPWGGRFYWCAFCNYVNTEDEKGAARCPRHRQEWERTRKAAQRAEASKRSKPGGGSVGDGNRLSELEAIVDRADVAVRAVERNLLTDRTQSGDDDVRSLVGATRELLRVVGEMQQQQRTGR
jgi:hypothetical protein